MKVDLHCHTTCSDGSLTPQELVRRACDNGVTHLSITDHDTVAAYAQISTEDCPVKLIPGIEFSTTWRKQGVHIVGLEINLDSAAIAEGVQFQTAARLARAEQISSKLSAKGLDCKLEDVQKLAGSDHVGRPHFAQHLVNTGAVKNQQQAFKKYLGAGKPGDVKQHWASMQQVIDWIRGAGGIAVLAHPLKYKMTRTKLLALVEDFKNCGGRAMEVVSGKQIPSDTRNMLNICEQFDLLASCGSDFHHPGLQWSELGQYSVMPKSKSDICNYFKN